MDKESVILKEAFTKQMAANEEMLIRLQIKKPLGATDVVNNELLEMRDRSHNEYV
jgi:hypothetical protein